MSTVDEEQMVLKADKSEQIVEFMFSENEVISAVEHSFLRGVRDKTLKSFCHDGKRRLIAKDILDGNYVIGAPKMVAIPKPDGGTRNILINGQQDRIVLSMVYSLYARGFGSCVHESCVSYKKGLGVGRIARSLLKELKEVPAGTLGMKLDISKYFDKVPQEIIVSTLKRFSTCNAIDKMLLDYYSTNEVINDGELTERYKGLAQGCSMAAFLANVVLYELDSRMSEVCQIYRRYSDDIVFFTDDLPKAIRILMDCVDSVGLELNLKKTDVLISSMSFDFLGLRFDAGKGTIDLSKENLIRVKNEVRALTKPTKKSKGSKDEIARVIKAITRRLLNSNYRNIAGGATKQFSWCEYMFSVVSSKESVRELDFFIRDRIRAMYTGGHNTVTNCHKMPNETLEKLGYISLTHMFSLYQIDKEVYKAELRRLGYVQKWSEV